MTTPQIALLVCSSLAFLALGLLSFFSGNHNLNIKSKTVGDGQHGTARWATKQEIARTFAHVPFTPKLWRNRDSLPQQQGIVVGCQTVPGKVTALVDTGDVHALMIGAAGVGKTAFFMIPNLEYACASGMSFLVSDTKGDLYRQYAPVAKEQYGYEVSILDLRNPTCSDGFNMLYLINRYMDEYLQTGSLATKAKAERYAKITAKTIISSDGADHGQNSFFYEAAEGLLTSVFLMIAEFSAPQKRHIVSAFKLIQDLMAASPIKDKSLFQILMDKFPSDHKTRWFAGAALNSIGPAMASVLSTAMSRLNTFLDSELEQILCFDTKIDAETFAKRKSAVFIVMPEENPGVFFLVSLIVQQLYRELLSVADELGGKLPNRVLLLLDEFGTIPKIESAEMMFSAARSRRISIVAIIQSLAQLEKNYGKEGASIIWDNSQLTIFGGFAPNSDTANTLSKNLGEKTVMSGSISKGKGDGSRSLQMMGRALITPDELKSMPKGHFIVTKTGGYPMQSTLKLFTEWGITFDKEYTMRETPPRRVEYADRLEIEDTIRLRYPPLQIPKNDDDDDFGDLPPTPKKKPKATNIKTT